MATQEASKTNRRSNRTRHPTEKLIKETNTDIKAKTNHDVGGEIFCLSEMFLKEDPIGKEDPLLAYKASSNPDTLYMHESMKDSDRN